jgi:endoglucanase
MPHRADSATIRRLLATPALALALTLTTVCAPARAATSEEVLRESWAAYKTRYIQSDGRVLDPSTGYITTSEGQSYAMLRAAWMDDRETFARAWTWTLNNLHTGKHELFAWKWGQRCDKSWGILDEAAASDADQDMALALIIAGSRWSMGEYTEKARALLGKIWAAEVVTAGGKPFLTAGEWGPPQAKPKLNPSYLAPYAYRIFATIDPQHDWLKLVDTSYEVLFAASAESRIGLPPDWCYLDKATGKISINRNDKESDYSYDAMRTPWRVALDWAWNSEPRAKRYLDQLGFLRDSWRVTRTIRGAYTASGVMRSFDEPVAGFGCVLPYFQIAHPDLAKQVSRERVLARYDAGIFGGEDDYYGQNWAWFGLAAAGNLLAKPQVKSP